MRRWVNTLKFKIVALAVITGVLSAVGTAQLILSSTRADIERLLLQNESSDRESTAALLANKLDTLQITLIAMARQAQPAMWLDRNAMTRFLLDKPAINVLFDGVFAATPEGVMLTRLAKGVPTAELPNIADREYFRRAMKTDKPVVSDPLLGRVNNAPLVLIAVAARGIDGKSGGVVAGYLDLKSARLFSDLGSTDRRDGSRSMVMDRTGVLLAHPDPARVLGRAADEPGLAEVFRQWHALGSPIDTAGTARLSSGYLVSMAGIAASDWVLVRLTPQSIALQPVVVAQRTAWISAAGVGFAAALLAGGVAWLLTRPISRLRARAERMLTQHGPSTEPWPSPDGELGDLARAFQQVVDQRQLRQAETEVLLQRLEAVMDHADIGIALTRESRFELVSRHFCEIFRCEKLDALGQPTRLIYPSDEAYQALSARASPAFMEHGGFDGEVELMRTSGQPFWARMRGRALVPGDRTKGTIWTVEDVSEARAQRERLTWTSSHDALTGLANRPAFEVLLEKATGAAAREPFCAMFLDLDRFKQVNDTGGHAAGDALLRDVARQLAGQVRKSDTVARLGGDEFAVLLSRCSLSQGREIAEKLRSAVEMYRLSWEGQSFGVGASIGLVEVDSSYGTAADVLRAADAACYAAKQQGRNRVVVHGAGAVASN